MSQVPTQFEMFEVPSPCVGVCQSGKKGYCLGCYRSREERLYWHQVDDATKRVIVKACYRRKRAALARKNKLANANAEQGPQEQRTLF